MRASLPAALMIGLLVAPVPAAPPQAAAGAIGSGTQVLLTKEQALRVVFPECESALEVRRLLSTEEKETLAKSLHRSLGEKGFLVYLGLRGGLLDGFAVITNEIGKTEPITFIVAVNRDGTVRRVAVMVYRESHGGEVKARRFLVQFEGKSRSDPLELHRDVINVSGATLSATALCEGTRKVLAFLGLLYLPRDGAAIVAQARTDGARELALSHDPVLASASRLEARRLVMGSELRVVACGVTDRQRPYVERALDAAERLDAVLSDWRDDSELAKVNREAATHPVAVSPPMLDFLVQSAELHAATGGAFDPSIGELVRRWGFRGGPVTTPDSAELEALRMAAGFDGVRIDAAARTVAFVRPGIRLDPGAIGKGLAVDAVAAALHAAGLENFLVDFGSSMLARGPGETGERRGGGEGGEEGQGSEADTGWSIAIRDPAHADRVIELLDLHDAALSTSGGYEKFVEIDGRRLPHILDPRSGRPVEQSASATVIAATAARADALSTALFVLGAEKGSAMLERLPDAAGLFVPATPGASPIRTHSWPVRSHRWPVHSHRRQ